MSVRCMTVRLSHGSSRDSTSAGLARTSGYLRYFQTGVSDPGSTTRHLCLVHQCCLLTVVTDTSPSTILTCASDHAPSPDSRLNLVYIWMCYNASPTCNQRMSILTPRMHMRAAYSDIRTHLTNTSFTHQRFELAYRTNTLT